MKVDRRDFVRFVTGGALGTAATGVTVRGISRFNAAVDTEQVKVPGGPETWSLGVCSLCDAGCGLRVRSIGKRVVKVQGNPLSPVNHGGLCPKGLAALQELYHPDRLRKPLKNVGSRRSPRFREISWEEASGAVLRKLRELRDAGRAHGLVAIDRGERSLASRLLRRFVYAYGSPNYLTMPSGNEALETAIYLQQGVRKAPAFDWERTRYLLSFGVNLLEGWGSPATLMRAFGAWRDSSAGRRTKFVQADPRFSVTAARADEWVALKPGTEAALALGIAYVLITEDLYDAAFVREHTFGFEDWRDSSGKNHMGFRTLVLSDYRLDDVAAGTGVPAETILRLAREFARNRPAVAIGDQQAGVLPGNPYAAMAVHSLNALVGSVDAPGGVLLETELPLAADSAPQQHPRIDQASEHSFPGHHFSLLPRAITAERPYRVEALLLHQANPVFTLPNGPAFRDALRAVPFIASFSSFMDETSVLADIILPAATGLECWQGASSPRAIPHAVFSLAAPVISPRHGTRNPADVVLDWARGLRGPVAAALPYTSFEEYLKRSAEELFASQSGAVFSAGLEETWNRMLERSGWWAPTWSKSEELWDQMRQKGGWWEPAYSYGEWDRVFQTPSRRFEFYSQRLAEWAAAHPDFARRAGLGPGDDRLSLPHQPPQEEATRERPLLLMPVEVLPLARGTGAHLPYLQQIAGAHVFSSWESWLEIHPETAKKLGIADGDLVWIESARGRLRARARHYAGAHPEVVHLPLGYGHSEGSQWGRRGVNPLAILEEHYEPLAGLPQAFSTRVRVYRS